MTSLVLFLSSFNLLGIILFFPFLNQASRFLESLFKTPVTTNLKFINLIPLSEKNEFIEGLAREKHNFEKQVRSLIRLVFDHNHVWYVEGVGYPSFLAAYNQIKEYEGEIYSILSQFQNQDDTGSAGNTPRSVES